MPGRIFQSRVARGVAQITQASLVNRIGNGIVGDVQVQLFGKLIRADLARLRTAHSGAYVSSVLYDAGLIREAATSGVVNYTQHFLTVGGAVAVGEALVVCEAPGDGDSGSAGAGVPATVKLTEPDTGWPSSDTTRYPIV